MGLFKKKKSAEKTPLIPDNGIPKEDPVNYSSVLDYIVRLSRYDYEKILKVASIYRTANKEANKILGIKEEPTAAIKEDIAASDVAKEEETTEEQLDFLITDTQKEAGK